MSDLPDQPLVWSNFTRSAGLETNVVMITDCDTGRRYTQEEWDRRQILKKLDRIIELLEDKRL